MGLSDTLIEVALTFQFTSGVRTIEGYTNGESDVIRFSWPADFIALLNFELQEPQGYQCVEAWRAIPKAAIEQILETIRSRLLTFLLEIDQIGQYTPDGFLEVPPQAISQMTNQILVQGGNVFVGGSEMSTFDQRNQQVTYQYNAAGDINFNNVSNASDFSSELMKLLEEVEKAQSANLLAKDNALEAEYHLVQASKEAEKSNPEKRDVLSHLDKVKEVIEDAAKVAGSATALYKLGEAIAQAIQLSQSLF